MPGPGGKGSRVVGKAQAWVRRLDNSFFAGLTGGLPRLTTDLERGNDGILHFTNLQLYSPKLRLSGQGIRRRDGTFLIEARGRQAQYGPLRLRLDGRIERPQGRAVPRPRPTRRSASATCGCSSTPTAQGFDYRANGQSRLGPFTSNGQILLPKGGRATIDIAALDVAGTTARGALRSDPGGFTGELTAGRRRASTGRSAFARSTATSRSRRILTANNVSFAGPPAISVRDRAGSTGRSSSPRGATTLDGVVTARGLHDRRRSRLARLTANARLVNGAGAGPRGAGRDGAARAFELVTLANVTPDRISITGRGEVDRRPLTLDSPAVLTRGRRRLGRSRRRGCASAAGAATLSGRTGDRPEFHADIAGDAAATARHRLAQGSGSAGSPAGGSTIAGTGQPSGQRQPARPRPEPRRAGAGVEADRRRAQRRCSTAAGRRCARSRSATARPSAGRRRGSRRSAAGRSSPS